MIPQMIDIDTAPESSYFDALRRILDQPIFREVASNRDVYPYSITVRLENGYEIFYYRARVVSR